MMKQGEPRRAIGYVRVSTDEQVEGFSLEGQAERIQSYTESQDSSPSPSLSRRSPRLVG